MRSQFNVLLSKKFVFIYVKFNEIMWAMSASDHCFSTQTKCRKNIAVHSESSVYIYNVILSSTFDKYNDRTKPNSCEMCFSDLFVFNRRLTPSRLVVAIVIYLFRFFLRIFTLAVNSFEVAVNGVVVADIRCTYLLRKYTLHKYWKTERPEKEKYKNTHEHTLIDWESSLYIHKNTLVCVCVLCMHIRMDLICRLTYWIDLCCWLLLHTLYAHSFIRRSKYQSRTHKIWTDW